jgi:hypothetical protein
MDKKSTTFCNVVQQHDNCNNWPPTCAKRLIKSLEMKWGPIQHDVSKFVVYHGFVVAFNEFETSKENTLQKAL